MAKKKPAKKSVNRPEPFDDLHTQGDHQAVPGAFAEVVSGPHDGRYGVVVGVANNKTDVQLRTRDDEAELLVVKYADLRPAEAGRR